MSDLPLPARRADRLAARSLGLSPNAVLAVSVLVLCAMLFLVRTLPVGPMYWDSLIYFDAANRIFSGQTPSLDFFAPVGPLGYWLFAGGLKLFPNAQPLLLVDWSLLVVSAPLMALVLSDVGRRSRALAFALLLPFLFFSVMPFNIENFSSFPGTDGFGIYNRQGTRLLCVLASALLFCEASRRLVFAVAGAMLALFLTKITGFLVGGLLCLAALLAGRIRVPAALAVACLFLFVLVVLEAALGAVLPYLKDISTLVSMNEGDMALRFLQSASVHFGAFLPCTVLTGLLFVFSRRTLLADAKGVLRERNSEALAAMFNHPAFWMAAATLAALFYETQNTGSQAFIFVWPALLLVLLQAGSWQGWRSTLVVGLVAACSLPTTVIIMERAGRAFIGALRYERIDAPNIGTVGAVTQRSELAHRADMLLDIYVKNPDYFHQFVEAGELPSHTLYTEPDYQIAFLKAVDEGVAAINLYEMANDVHFDTVLNLGFVNPFPYILDRRAPRFVSIGADPFRTVPPPDEKVAEAIHATDLLLYSKCPETAANHDLLKIYHPFMTDHHRIPLGRCWDGFVRNGLGQ